MVNSLLFFLMVAITLALSGISPSLLLAKSQYALAQEEIIPSADVNRTKDPDFPVGEVMPLTTNESLLLGETLQINENLTETGDNITSAGNVTDGAVQANITSAGNVSGVDGAQQLDVPSVVHLRVKIHYIQVYRDHDGPWRGDGEWNLLGIVSCCGGAINSNMPTTGYTFNAPGADEGEIDTPDNEMNDVTGERRGGWGTVETIHFADVKQDFDIDNTNPLSEISINFFGIEDDKITATDLPPIPDIQGTDYDDYARAVRDLIVYLNNLQSVDHLGNVNHVFTRANNYGVGGPWSAASDLIYDNVWYKSEQIERICISDPTPPPFCFERQDWPDFPDYIIAYSIIDRDGPRCGPGFYFDYTTGECIPIIIP